MNDHEPQGAEVAPGEDRAPLGHRLGDLGSRLGRQPTERHLVRRALQVGLVALILGFLVFTIASQWGELKDRTDGFDAVWLLPSIPLIVTHFVMAGFGWGLLARFMGHPLSPLRAQVVWAQPLLARYVPGSVLFVMGRILLSEREGIPRRTSIAMIAYEVGLSFAAAAAIGGYFFIDHPDLQDQPLRFAALAALPAALVFLHPRVFRPLSTWALAKFGREPLDDVLSFRAVLTMFAYYLLPWVALGGAIYCIAHAVADVDSGDIIPIAAAQALAFCASVLSIVAPGGLGIRDGAFAWAVKVSVGGSFVVGAAIAIAVRLVMTLVEVVYAGVITAIGRRVDRTRDG